MPNDQKLVVVHLVHAAAFYDRLTCTEASGVRLIVLLQPLQHHKSDTTDRQIGYQNAVAVSSPIVQIAVDMPISNVRCHYRSDTTSGHVTKIGSHVIHSAVAENPYAYHTHQPVLVTLITLSTSSII